MLAWKQEDKIGVFFLVSETGGIRTKRDLLFTVALGCLTLSAINALDAQIGVDCLVRRLRIGDSLDSAEDTAVGLSSSILTAVSDVGDAALFDVPLLNGADDVDGELTVALEGRRPVGGDLVGGGQLTCNGRDQHLAHLVVLIGLGVDVLNTA